MLLPHSILREYVLSEASPEQWGDMLTMAGFELEGMEIIDSEAVYDLKVMANRGDALSAIGMARELLAKDPQAKATSLYEKASDRFALSDASNEAANFGSVSIQTDKCTRFAFRVFRDVQNGASPDWLVERLSHAGMRSISLIVDLTNYVMLETGQPLHAYDLDTLPEGKIIVRQAKSGEKITTLDGNEHELCENDMLICDANRAIGVAGVMGGLDTEMKSSTKHVLLEAAHFDYLSVRKTRKRLNQPTEASYRFERKVDPKGVVAALNRFAMLYHEITGHSCVNGVVDVFPNPPESRQVSVRVSRACKMLGMEVSVSEAKKYLSALGFELSGDGEPFVCQIPSWRSDVEIENDLIEEIARVHGYEKIPDRLPMATTTQGGVFGVPAILDRAREALVRCGLKQMISHSLRNVHPLDFTTDQRVKVRNPHSPEMAYLIDSTLPALADAALRNGGRNLALFEIANVFVQGEYEIDESPELGILMTGDLFPRHWRDNSDSSADFFAAKGLIETLSESLRIPISFDTPRLPDRRFHPTRQAGILVDENRLWVGTVGQIHPEIAAEIGLPEATFMAELDMLVFAFQESQIPVLKPVGRHPAVRRDIAILIDKQVPYATISAAIMESGGELLERHWLFDVYEGSGLPEGAHSLAIGLQFRNLNANMTDADANAERDRVVGALVGLGATQR